MPCIEKYAKGKKRDSFNSQQSFHILRVIQQLSKWKHNEILKAIAEWSLYTMDFWFSSSQPNLYCSLLLLSERVASNTKGERHSFYSDSSTLLVSQKHRGGTLPF